MKSISRSNINSDSKPPEEGTQENPWNISATEEDSVKAWLSDDGVLTIYGTGKIKDFYNNLDIPWNSQYEKVVSVIIYEGITSIGDNAFSHCENITKVLLPEGLTNIGSNAFYKCSFTEIIIPEEVTRVGFNAFGSCLNLTEITIPKGITKIEKNIFEYCESLTNINVDENNTKYSSKNGILFNKEKTKIICYPANKNENTYIIPEEINYIDDSAFCYCQKLSEIIISENVTYIGHYAFRGCSSLEEITIPEGVTNIGNDVFYGCRNLQNIEVYCNSYGEEYIRNNYEDKLQKIHNYEEIIEEATCTEQGYMGHRCTRCYDNYIDNYIEALGHNYEVTIIESTCTGQGYTEHRCTRCDDNYRDNYVEELGHNYGNWIVDKEATFDEEGHKYRDCIRCSDRQEESIPILIPARVIINGDYIIKKNKYVVLNKDTTVQELKNNIRVEYGEIEKITIENLTEDGKLKTGSSIRYDNEEQYIISVKGDISGDGKIDFINDIIMLNNYRLKRINLKEESTIAGDIDNNDKIDFINDIIRLNNYRLGKIKSL